MAERLDAGLSIDQTGQASRRVSETGPRGEPDEATRARFEQDLREADRQAATQDDAVAIDATQRGEENAVDPSCTGVGACPALLPVMALPVPASIPGQAPTLSSAPQTLAQHAAPQRSPLPTMIPVPETHAAEDVRLAMTVRIQDEALVVDSAPPAPGGGDKAQAGASAVKATPTPTPVPTAAAPATSLSAGLPSDARPDPAAVRDPGLGSASTATPDAPRVADTQPAARQAGEVPSTGGWGQSATASLPAGVVTQASAADGPRVLPDQVIADAVNRLMVGVDLNGARQVRVELRNEWMPGVRMVLQEVGGRVQIDLICSVEASRQRLSAISGREVGDIARRCKRDLLVRVHSEESADAEDSPDCHVVLGVA